MPKNTKWVIISQSLQDGACFVSFFVVHHALWSLGRLTLHLVLSAAHWQKPSGEREEKTGPSLWVTEHTQLGDASKTGGEKLLLKKGASAGSGCDRYKKDPTARGEGMKATPLRTLKQPGKPESCWTKSWRKGCALYIKKKGQPTN